MKHTFKKGQALIIRGPQGSGKSTLAREIAKANGTYVETNFCDYAYQSIEADILSQEPDTVIIDEFILAALRQFKGDIASDRVMVNKKGVVPYMVKTPNFIFVTGDADALPLDKADRRFAVIDLG